MRTAGGHTNTRTRPTPSYGHMLQCYTAQRFCFFVSFLFFLAFAGIKSLVFKQYCRSNKKRKWRNWIRSTFFFFNKLLSVLWRAWYSSIQYSSTRSNYCLNRQWNAHLFIPSSLTHQPRNQPANSRFQPPLLTGCIQPASPSLTSWFPAILLPHGRVLSWARLVGCLQLHQPCSACWMDVSTVGKKNK